MDQEHAPTLPAGAPGAPAPRRDLPLTTAIVLAVSLAFVAGFGVGRTTAPAGAPVAGGGSPSASAHATATPGPTATLRPIGAVDDPTTGITATGSSLGRADAPVTIEVWSDFQCPFCARYALELEPWIIETYVVPGTVRLVHRDLAFIGTESLDAAVLARHAATQNRFWAVYELLYGNQAGENKGGFARDRLITLAGLAGLDRAAATAALDDAGLQAQVTAEGQAAFNAGITSTPTMLVNGTKLGSGIPQRATLAAAIEAIVKAR